MPIINSLISAGKNPTGTKQITSNGTHDVTDYANAEVNVPTTAPELYRVFRNNNGTLENSITTPFIPLSNITTLSNYILYKCYYKTPSSIISGAIDLSSLEMVGENALHYAFGDCPGITSVDLSGLIRATGTFALYYTFQGCTNLTSFNLDSLTVLSVRQVLNYTFASTGLITGAFPSLKTVTGRTQFSNTFSSCQNLTSLSFPALTSTSFGSSIDQFNSMLYNVTGCTIHFPLNMQSIIETMSGYPNFGGKNTIVLFDLPSTAHLIGNNTNEYERNPKYDTATALAWRVKDTGTDSVPIIDWIPYYTVGLTDPTVGTTLYSDSTCTTAVTTISSIA